MALWYVNPGKSHKKRRHHAKRQRATKGKFQGTFTSRRHNPWLRETGMLFGNPRHHPRHHAKRRHSGGGRGLGLMQVVKNPGHYLSEGGAGILGAFFAISLPNWLLPFPGTDLMSKVLRGLTRVAAGSLVYMGAKQIMPRQAQAVLTGTMIGAFGSFVLDILGTQIKIGAGDTAQTPGMIFAGLGLTAGGTTGAYARQLIGAYSRPQLAAARGLSGVFSGETGPALTRHSLYTNN